MARPSPGRRAAAELQSLSPIGTAGAVFISPRTGPRRGQTVSHSDAFVPNIVPNSPREARSFDCSPRTLSLLSLSLSLSLSLWTVRTASSVCSADKVEVPNLYLSARTCRSLGSA